MGVHTGESNESVSGGRAVGLSVGKRGAKFCSWTAGGVGVQSELSSFQHV
jgi:hypothetical protein